MLRGKTAPMMQSTFSKLKIAIICHEIGDLKHKHPDQRRLLPKRFCLNESSNRLSVRLKARIQ